MRNIANAMTVAAIKRVMSELQATLQVEEYAEVGRPYLKRFGPLDVHIPITDKSTHSIHISQQTKRDGVRGGIQGAAFIPHTGKWRLIMTEAWCNWQPARLTLTTDDIQALTELAIKGTCHLYWEPDWRLYGAGLIDIEIQRGDEESRCWFVVSLSSLGADALLEDTGRNVAELKADRIAADKQRQVDLAKRHIHMSPRYSFADEVRIDFTMDDLPALIATYSISVKRLHFSGSISDENITHPLSEALFGEFMHGVANLLGPVKRGQRGYYDLNTNKFIREE